MKREQVSTPMVGRRNVSADADVGLVPQRDEWQVPWLARALAAVERAERDAVSRRKMR